MQVNGPIKVKGPTVVNLKHSNGQKYLFAISFSPTFETMAPPLNVVQTVH